MKSDQGQDVRDRRGDVNPDVEMEMKDEDGERGGGGNKMGGSGYSQQVSTVSCH